MTTRRSARPNTGANFLDLDEPVSLLACHLTEEFGYVDNGEAAGEFTTTEPVPLTIDLTALLD